MEEERQKKIRGGERKRERGAGGGGVGSGGGGKEASVPRGGWRGKEWKKTRRNYKEYESPKCQVTAGDNVGNWGGRRVVGVGGVEIKGVIIEAEGVTHTWKMVFWSPTTSPSPTVRVS